MTGAEERGSLTIEDRVVERVASYAVSQVTGAAAAPRRVLGVAVGDAEPDRDAQVDARVDGDTAVLEASIAVRWPLSIARVVADVRRRVVDEVTATTGLRVDHVDVEVVALTSPATRDAARVR